MSTFTLDNPIVRNIFEEAVKAAQPVWFAFTEDGAEATPRTQVYFVKMGEQDYVNGNSIDFEYERKTCFNGGILAKTKTAPPFVGGPLSRACPGEKGWHIIIAEGDLHVCGPITSELHHE